MIVAAVLVGAALSGCSDDDVPSSATSASTPPTSPSTPVTSPTEKPASDALDDLRSAVSAMARSELIDFTYEMRTAGVTMILLEGTQRVSGGWSASATFDDPSTAGPDTDLSLAARSDHGVTWMQMGAWPAPMSGCWLAMKPSEVPVGILGLRRDEVGYVSLLAGLRAVDDLRDSSDGRIGVAIPLRYAEVVLPGQLLQTVTLDPKAARRTLVDAEITLDAGRVATIDLAGSAFAQAIAGAAGTISTEVAQLLDLTSVTVTYPAGPAGAVAGPPPPDLVLTEETATQGCR